MKQLNSFIRKYNGKYTDFDGHYGPQCVDLARRWLQHIKVSQVKPGNADVWFKNASKKHFVKVKYKKGRVPKPGDLVCWSGKFVKNGHISVAVKGDKKSFVSFDQNFPLKSRCHKQKHTYKGVVGWLIPRVLIPKPPKPVVAPEPPITHTTSQHPSGTATVGTDPIFAEPEEIPERKEVEVKDFVARLSSRKFLLALATALTLYLNGDVQNAVFVVLAYLGVEGAGDFAERLKQ